VFLSARIAGSEDILHSHLESRKLNALSVMVPTSPNIIASSLGAAKPMKRLIPPD